MVSHFKPFFQIDRIWVTVSHSNLVPYDPICGRPFWFAYLADIFAEVHLTFSMNYFPLEAKVNHLFVSPFHHDIVGTKIETLAHAIYATISWTYAIYLFIKGFKWFELFRQYLEEKKWLEVVMLGHILEMDLIEDIEQSLLLALRCLKFA